jgi:hypothetical protein
MSWNASALAARRAMGRKRRSAQASMSCSPQAWEPTRNPRPRSASASEVVPVLLRPMQKTFGVSATPPGYRRPARTGRLGGEGGSMRRAAERAGPVS